jgi:hypothetical protein
MASVSRIAVSSLRAASKSSIQILFFSILMIFRVFSSPPSGHCYRDSCVRYCSYLPLERN